jgi:hypothetical protein
MTALGGKSIKPRIAVMLGFSIFITAGLVGQITGMLKFSAPSLQTMAQKGTLRVEDIKGSSTYQSVADSFGIELDRLYREVGVDRNVVPPNSMIKDTGKLSGIDGFEADLVRIAVAKIIGVPYAGESGKAPRAVNNATPAGNAPIATSFELEGTMTIQDIATALNVSDKIIIDKLNLPSDIPVNRPLRDLKDEYGFSMPALKEKINK